MLLPSSTPRKWAASSWRLPCPWPAAAVLSLALTVLASVRRRRHELALLKALGMTRGQVRAITAWQTTLTLLIALAAGLPLGIVTGRWAWRSFAASLGVVPVTVIPCSCWPQAPRR
jgi:predicted lysophospholipase L1 biosynthesis ABC-type transport system permease subunit